MSESYLGGSRGLAALGSSVLDDALDSSAYWGELYLMFFPLTAAGDVLCAPAGCWGSPTGPPAPFGNGDGGWFLTRTLCFGEGGEFSTRRRRGTGDTESSKINGLLESKTYDTYTSSSGYSSEDDYAGRDALASLRWQGCWGKCPQGDQPSTCLCSGCCQPHLHATPYVKPSPWVTDRGTGAVS